MLYFAPTQAGVPAWMTLAFFFAAVMACGRSAMAATPQAPAGNASAVYDLLDRVRSRAAIIALFIFIFQRPAGISRPWGPGQPGAAGARAARLALGLAIS